jgi:CRP-like cAMP-binding protein
MEFEFDQFGLFKNLSEDNFEFLKKDSKKVMFGRGELIFCDSESTDYLYLLLDGQVKLFRARKGTQKEEIVCMIQSGQDFCLAPLLAQETYHISAQALTESVVLVLSKKVVLDLLNCSHQFAKNVVQYLALKECSTCERNCDLSLSTTQERLAKYLLQQWEEQNKPRSLKLVMTQHQLASHLGTVRETLSRDMMGLKNAKVVEVERGRVRVLKPEELEKMVM